MATAISVNGKTVTRPGVYALTKSGIKNPSPNLSYGNVCIIDDGIGTMWGGGSGVSGTLKSGVDAVYELTTIQQFRDFVKGGELWNLAKPLFKPAENGINGISKAFLVRACETTPATISYTFDAGSVTFQTLDEGVNANGVLAGSILNKGYACKIVKNTTTGKYIIQFYAGTYKGIDPLNRVSYDGLTQTTALANNFLSSKECSTVQELIDWCNTSNEFKAVFNLTVGTSSSNTAAAATFDCTPLATVLDIPITLRVNDPVLGLVELGSHTPTTGATATSIAAAFKAIVNTYAHGYSADNTAGSLTVTAPASYGASINGNALGFYYSTGSASADFAGGVDVASSFIDGDVTDNTGYNLASGGTEVYTTAAFNAAIEAIKETDNTFFLATSYGVTNAIGLNNTKIFDYLENDSKYEKFMVVGAGYDKSEFAGTSGTSEAVSKYYNSDKVITVHGAAKETSKAGFLVRSQLYKAAAVLGRLAGVAPQTPLTFKNIAIDGEIHSLTDTEKEFALSVGILTTHFDSELGYFVIQQGINSLQNNQYLINEDASSFDIAVKRIEAQLNKEICIRAKQVFFSKTTTGPNRTTVSEENVKAWLEGFLQTKVATSLTDNLIIRFGNINVEYQSDNIFVTYEFVPIFPVNKAIFTGTLLDK